MQASGAPSLMARSFTVEHFCQLELQGTVENRSLVAGGVAFDILRCWKDVHLPMSEYSLQVKYKGEVTTKNYALSRNVSNGITEEKYFVEPCFQHRRMSNATPPAGEDLFSTVSCNSD